MRKKHINLNCSCCICKAIRGETKGENNPRYGKKWTKEQRKAIKGINNPNYKTGNYTEDKIYYCIDNCGKEVSGEKRKCKTCFGKLHSLQMKGKNNPMYDKSSPMKGKTLSLKTRKAISKAMRGSNHPMYGKKRPDMKLINKMIKDKGLLKGKNHPMFEKTFSKKHRRNLSLALGGTGIPYENAKYPREFFKIRKKILKRDHYTCQNCNLNFPDKSGKLDVHHIDYNKKNNNENNLIVLCEKCNNKANYNRKEWEKKFSLKIKL